MVCHSDLEVSLEPESIHESSGKECAPDEQQIESDELDYGEFVEMKLEQRSEKELIMDSMRLIGWSAYSRTFYILVASAAAGVFNASAWTEI